MNIGIIGSGTVAQTIAHTLLTLEQSVMISSRDVTKDKDRGQYGKLPSVDQWVKKEMDKGYDAYGGSFDDAAKFGEILFNCTQGVHSLEAIDAAGEEHFKDKILIDLANPLDFSTGNPMLSFGITDSLGERIQTRLPNTRVVKTLNTVAADIMVDPAKVPGIHTIFIAGNDDKAKQTVKDEVLMGWFGWKDIIDLGDITAARVTEGYLPLWLRLWGTLNTPYFNIHVVRKNT